MTSETHSTDGTTDALLVLRSHLRRLCIEHDVPVEQRARLVLSATTLARASGGADRAAAVTGHVRTDPDTGTTLTVTVRLPAPPGDRALPDLPMPPDRITGASAVWRIQVPWSAAEPEPVEVPDEGTAGEEELRATIARADALGRAHRMLRHELSETNSGVLAMYVEVEERDEELRRAHAVIFRELEDALRPPPLTVPGVELGVHYQPAGPDAPTGGDLYDWFLLPDGTLHITVVDAVGHGVTCTRNALNVTHTVRTLALHEHPLEDLVKRTAHINSDLMATVLLARLDPRTGLLRLAGGSHPPALLLHADGHTYLTAAGRGVGFPDPGSTEIRTGRLEPGDVLMLYTDGLIESRGDADADEIRLGATGREHLRLPIDVLPGTVVRDMHDAVRYTDDTLLLAARFSGA